MYSNGSVNGTKETAEPMYVCCNANTSSTSTDYGYTDSENDEMSPGVCCVQEPLPLWVTILLVIIFFILCTGCCVLCCVVRPKLEALMRRFETPRINADTIQTMAALKVLSTDTNPTGNQNPSQGQGLFASGITFLLIFPILWSCSKILQQIERRAEERLGKLYEDSTLSLWWTAILSYMTKDLPDFDSSIITVKIPSFSSLVSQ